MRMWCCSWLWRSRSTLRWRQSFESAATWHAGRLTAAGLSPPPPPPLDQIAALSSPPSSTSSLSTIKPSDYEEMISLDSACPRAGRFEARKSRNCLPMGRQKRRHLLAPGKADF